MVGVVGKIVVLAVCSVGMACGIVGVAALRVRVVYWSVAVTEHSVVVRLTLVGTSDLT